jgi:hypothetical protein
MARDVFQSTSCDNLIDQIDEAPEMIRILRDYTPDTEFNPVKI